MCSTSSSCNSLVYNPLLILTSFSVATMALSKMVKEGEEEVTFPLFCKSENRIYNSPFYLCLFRYDPERKLCRKRLGTFSDLIRHLGHTHSTFLQKQVDYCMNCEVRQLFIVPGKFFLILLHFRLSSAPS